MCTLTNKIFEGDKEYIYTYEIIKDEIPASGENVKLNYGIRTNMNIITGQNVEFQCNSTRKDISEDKKIVEDFINKICKYCVSPINMNDVIEDLLIQIA